MIFMKLLRFLFKYSPQTLIFVTFLGVISGLTNASVIAVIHQVINYSGSSFVHYIWTFIGLVLITMIATFSSQFIFYRLSQHAIYDLKKIQNIDIPSEVDILETN